MFADSPGAAPVDKDEGLGLSRAVLTPVDEIAALRARVAELEEEGEQLKAQLNGQDMVLLVEIARLNHDNTSLRDALELVVGATFRYEAANIARTALAGVPAQQAQRSGECPEVRP